MSEGADVDTFVAQVLVSDADSGENGRVTCSLDNSVAFRMTRDARVENEFMLVTQTTFDRELVASYALSIRCRDHGNIPQQQLEQVTVAIDDVNDNDPTFSEERYSVSIEENREGGTLLTSITASDRDEGDNARLTYFLSSDVESKLYVTTTSQGVAQVRTISAFDRETEQQFEFVIYARDGGDEPRTGSTTISVTILDVNDQSPRFVDTPYTFEHAEEQVPFLELGEVKATDADSYPSNFVTYSLDPDSQTTFDIDSLTGKLKSRVSLDRETQSFHDVVVIATDSGAPPLSAAVTVRVNVIDVNDNDPVFQFPSDSNRSVTMSSAHDVSTPVTQLRATDADAGDFGRVVYSLEPQTHFDVNPINGDVMLRSDVTRFADTNFSLSVWASDLGNPARRSNVTSLFVFVSRSDMGDPAAQSEARKPNETAVIAVACVAGSLITLLVAGIALLLCRRQNHDKRKQQQLALKNAFVTITHKQACVDSHRPPLPDVTSQTDSGDVTVTSETAQERRGSKRSKKGSDNLGFSAAPHTFPHTPQVRPTNSHKTQKPPQLMATGSDTTIYHSKNSLNSQRAAL